MDMFRILLLLISLKCMSICKYYYIYECIYVVIKWTLPSPMNTTFNPIFLRDQFRLQVIYSMCLWRDLIATLVAEYISRAIQ